MGSQGPRKIILTRMGAPSVDSLDPPKNDVIQKNLQPLIQNIEKKKRAQEAYYQKSDNSGMSPMVRDLQKPPVRQRLGRKVPIPGTNTSMVPPKKRLYKNSTLNNTINKKKQLRRNNYAQMRLNKIRENQRQSLAMDNINYRKFRHRGLSHFSTPNLRIHVRNTGANSSSLHQGPKRHKICLDPVIQSSINQLKCVYTGEKVNILRITPKSTSIYLNDRFTALT